MVPQEPGMCTVLILLMLLGIQQSQPFSFMTLAVSYCCPGDSPLFIYGFAL